MPMCRAPAGAARHPQGRGAHALRALREAAAAAVDHEVAFRGGVSDPSNIALPAVTGRIDPPWGAEGDLGFRPRDGGFRRRRLLPPRGDA
jgi:hypothetical protein